MWRKSNSQNRGKTEDMILGIIKSKHAVYF